MIDSAARSRPNPPPATREALLATAGGAATEIYGAARRFIAELETTCPWNLLYGARADREAFLDAAQRLIEQVNRLPKMAAQVDRSLAAAGVTEAAREEIAFFVGSVHAVLAHDLGRLERAASRLSQADGGPRGDEIEEAAGLAADVLGKCASSLAGVATSIAAETRWAPEAVAAVLFPERAADRSRSVQLVEDLRALHLAIAELPGDLDPVSLLNTWRAGQRADRYALAPLLALRARIARLLDSRHRRALYTGDFHSLQRRERRLSARLTAIDRLHLAMLDGDAGNEPLDPAATGARLATLLLEAAAIIDVDLLTHLAGDSVLRQLRSELERAGDRPLNDDTTQGLRASSTISADLPEALHGLVPLVADEDLDTLVSLLLGTVLKRSALAATTAPEAAAAPPPSPGPSSRAERERAIRNLHDWLELRMGRANPSWNGFRMIGRLVSQRGPIPNEMFGSARGFADEIRRELVPMLQRFTALGPLANELARTFETDAELLTRDPIDPATMRHHVPVAMRRTQEQLEALRSATTSLLAGADRRRH